MEVNEYNLKLNIESALDFVDPFKEDNDFAAINLPDPDIALVLDPILPGPNTIYFDREACSSGNYIFRTPSPKKRRVDDEDFTLSKKIKTMPKKGPNSKDYARGSIYVERLMEVASVMLCFDKVPAEMLLEIEEKVKFRTLKKPNVSSGSIAKLFDWIVAEYRIKTKYPTPWPVDQVWMREVCCNKENDEGEENIWNKWKWPGEFNLLKDKFFLFVCSRDQTSYNDLLDAVADTGNPKLIDLLLQIKCLLIKKQPKFRKISHSVKMRITKY